MRDDDPSIGYYVHENSTAKTVERLPNDPVVRVVAGASVLMERIRVTGGNSTHSAAGIGTDEHEAYLKMRSR